MGYIIGIDPGKRHTAVVGTSAVKVLNRAARFESNKQPPANPSPAFRQVAECAYMTEKLAGASVTEVIRYQIPYVLHFVQQIQKEGTVDAVVIEKPKIYATGTARVDDIMDLMRVAGALEGALYGEALRVVTVEPFEWKGQVPKAVHNRRILEKAPELERFLKHLPAGKHEHIIDAYGIAAWYAGRHFNGQTLDD